METSMITAVVGLSPFTFILVYRLTTGGSDVEIASLNISTNGTCASSSQLNVTIPACAVIAIKIDRGSFLNQFFRRVRAEIEYEFVQN
jgi:hypothetical protein